MSDFLAQIDEFVQAHLPLEPAVIRDDKIVHDSVWGTIRVRRHEIALLDTPLMQRLRHIHQTSFAYLTFPAAVHTRFEHSMGCLFLADRFIEELKLKDCRSGKRLIQEDIEDNVRAAAILHDVGHGPFSHSSEEIYGDLPQFREVEAEYECAKPHEILSCLIIKSESFRKYIQKLNLAYGTRLEVQRIADAIAGQSEPISEFESDILNGSFDVDKIEYIIRDGRLIGLPSSIDLSRLLTALGISVDNDRRILTIGINGEITLEQLVFGKMILFNSVYQHHKARSCDCLLKGIFEYGRQHDVKFGNRSMDNPVDFLWWTDGLLTNVGADFKSDHPILHDLMHGLAYRRLPKRALIIAPDFIEKSESNELNQLWELRRNHPEHRAQMRDLAKLIWSDAQKPCPLEQIWVDLPKPPSFKEGTETIIREPSGKLCTLNQTFFQLDQWAEHFDQHKWRGHVFSPIEHLPRVSLSARKVLEEKYRINFKPISWQACHID